MTKMNKKAKKSLRSVQAFTDACAAAGQGKCTSECQANSASGSYANLTAKNFHINAAR